MQVLKKSNNQGSILFKFAPFFFFENDLLSNIGWLYLHSYVFM